MNLARRILMARRNWDDVVLLLKGDGPDGSTNIIDSSINNHSVTVSGDARIRTDQSVYPGGSSMFVSSGSFKVNGFYCNFYQNNFTVEFWYYQNSRRGMDYLVSTYGDNDSANRGWFLSTERSHHLRPSFFAGINGSALILQSDTAISLMSWNHLALTRNGNDFIIFLNGNVVATGANPSTLPENNYELTIGAKPPSNTYRADVYIQDLRITKNLARYTTNFTPPTAPLPTPGP